MALRASTSSANDVSSEEEAEEPGSQTPKRITFPVESILNAVIQDGDVIDLFHILCHRLSEININQRNHTGLTALHYAVLTNNLDSIKLLLNHGADVNVKDVYGFSPLHTAAALGYLHVTALLVVYGADVFSLTNQSELPIDLTKDISVIRLLSMEMYLQLQREHYYQSLAVYHLKRAYRSTLVCVVFIIKSVLFLLHQLIKKGSIFLGPYVSRYTTKLFGKKRLSVANGKPSTSVNRSSVRDISDIRVRKASMHDLELPNNPPPRRMSLKQD